MREEPSRWRKILQVVTLVWGWVLLGVLASTVGVCEVAADRTELGVLAASVGAKPLLVAAAVAALLTLLSRPKARFWLVVIANGALATWLGQPAWGTPGPGGLQPIKVVTLNMEHGLVGIPGVARFLDRRAADVICLQEAGPLQGYPNPLVVHPDLLRALRSYHVITDGQDLVIASKFPFRITRQDDLPEPAGAADKRILVAEIIHPSGDIAVGSIHLSPRQTDFSELASVRTAQIRACEKFLRARPRVILAGDFNAGPIGPNDRLLRAAAADAWRVSGRGFGFTTSGGNRIDRIWVKGLSPYRCETVNEQVSDHAAVVAWIR